MVFFPQARFGVLLVMLQAFWFLPSLAKKIRFPFKKMLVDAAAGATANTWCTNPDGTENFANTENVFCSAKDGNGVHSSPLDLIHLPKELQLVLEQATSAVGSVLLYKPPVGLVAIWSLSRLIKSGRLFRLYSTPETSEQALITKASRLDYHTGRALDLDADDERYQKFGGVERVRRRLALKAMLSLIEEGKNERVLAGEALPERLVLEPLIDVLSIQFPPSGSHGDLVQKMIRAFAEVEKAIPPQSGKTTKATSEADRVIEVAYRAAETRTLDAMLRLTRDRLLRSSFRLSRTVQHWKRRVQNQALLPSIVKNIFSETMDMDRMRLAFAEAAYRQEILKLGRVVGLLMKRPVGMDESHLVRAVEQTLELPDSNSVGGIGPSWIPSFSSFAVRFNADERGKIQFQHYDESITIGGRAARKVLLEDYPSKQAPWLKENEAWCLQARSMLYNLLEEALQSSVQPTEVVQRELEDLEKSWRTRDYSTPSEIPKQWDMVYKLVREIHKLRTVGEGKKIKLSDFSIVNYFQQFNLLGLPSAALRIFLAHLVHTHLFVPFWPGIQKLIEESYEISMEIITTRFWRPVKDLMTELMFRPKSTLLTGISLSDEELSLDNMLRDLDFGDGTPATRHEAMLKASRQYEDDMKTGLIRHAVGGRLIRLILIQVQQLKVGMLNAAETIDVLLQTNRFNIQLLAVIPAIVILTVGTKVFLRALFTVRVKDLRPMKSVHAEMTEYLNDLESIVLLADNSGGKEQAAIHAFDDFELGRFVLTLYKYLVLLDYSSPQPFPNWQCDAIHSGITAFLGKEGTLSRKTLDDQIRLIDQVKRKHTELSKHL